MIRLVCECPLGGLFGGLRETLRADYSVSNQGGIEAIKVPLVCECLCGVVEEGTL